MAINVELTDDRGDGTRFMEDVCVMLERIAQREGLTLEVVEDGPTARAYRLPQGADMPQRLLRECGVHRAQLVPLGSTTGHIRTSKVRVDTTARWEASPDVVLKTYNYPQSRVVWHASGTTFPLDQVLAGLTAPSD